MKLYLISQDRNSGYDTFDSAVVAAKSEDDARIIHPSEYVTHNKNGKWMGTYSERAGEKAGKEYEKNSISCEWIGFGEIDCIKVEYLGETEKERGVILASFNAG